MWVDIGFAAKGHCHSIRERRINRGTAHEWAGEVQLSRNHSPQAGYLPYAAPHMPTHSPNIPKNLAASSPHLTDNSSRLPYPTRALLRPPTHAKYGCFCAASCLQGSYFLWHSIFLQQATDKRPSPSLGTVLSRANIFVQRTSLRVSGTNLPERGQLALAGSRGATPWVWGC